MNPFDLGAEVFIVPILWGILIITVATMLFTSFKRDKMVVEDDAGEVILEKVKWTRNAGRIRRAIGLLVFGGLILASIVVVPPGHRGAVYTTNGISTIERGEGYSFIVPIFHNANMVNVREQVYENEEVYAQTRDLLEVTMQIGVNYYVTPDKAADIFRDVGHDYETALIKPAVLDIAKQEAGLIDALDFPRDREKLAESILSGLRARLEDIGITVTFVAIQDAIFPSAFVDAVRNKEIAEEKAEESLRLVDVAVNEAEQARQRASGEADALVTVAEAKREEQQVLGMSPTEYVWFKTWNGILPSTLLGESGDFIVDLPQGRTSTPDE